MSLQGSGRGIVLICAGIVAVDTCLSAHVHIDE